MGSSTEIDREQTRHVIEKAVRTQAQVLLESPALGREPVGGFFVSGDNRALLIELTGGDAASTSSVIHAGCDVQFHAGARYRFSSVITAAPHWGESRAVAVARPEHLHCSERRRLLRATLAPSSVVNLEWKRMGAIHRHSGALLNISADGLACRVPGGAAESLQKSDNVWVTFRLPWKGRTFRMEAQVTNRTPGSEDHVILGLQFEGPGSADHRRLLRECLENPHEADASLEACV